MPTGRAQKYLQGLKLLLRAMMRTPIIALKSINIFKYGSLALNLRLLYLITAFHGQKYDVIHVHFGPIGNLVEKMIEIGAIKGKLVVTFHGYDLNQKNIITQEGYYDSLFRAAHRLLVNSLFSYSKLLALGAPKNKVEIVPMPVDTDFFKRDNKSSKDNATYNLLSVSRLSEEKGLIYAIKAVEQYSKESDINIRYDIVGNGPLIDDLKNYVNKHNLNNHIHFLGEQTQEAVKELMNKSDVLLFPSIELPTGEADTQGLVIQEAQSMGLPVIASDVGGVKFGMKDGISGHLVEQKSVSQLVQALGNLLKDTAIRKKMGDAGRLNVIKNYSVDVVMERMCDLYSDVKRKLPI